jgi:TP901-1 family phage major tail protein
MILKGSDVMVFANISGTLTSIAYATNHQLTIGATSQEISTKDSGGGVWTEAAVQKLNWSMTTENMYSLDGAGINFEDIFDKMVAREAITVALSLDNTYANKPDNVPAAGWSPISTPKYTGTAYITDLQLNAPDGDNASFSATFTGIGALVQS